MYTFPKISFVNSSLDVSLLIIVGLLLLLSLYGPLISRLYSDWYTVKHEFNQDDNIPDDANISNIVHEDKDGYIIQMISSTSI